MTPKILIEIAREHARRGATFLRDEYGVPAFRVDSKTDLLGALIPQSLYYSTPMIESMTTYELCDGGIFTREELEIVNQIDHIQAIYDESKWVKKLDKLLRRYDK